MLTAPMEAALPVEDSVPPSSKLLYERLAGDVATMIDRGALRPGDRLPSVRTYARERSVSVATVLSAYLDLENRGLVEVRPKSGHYVRRRALEARPPRPPRLALVPQRINVSDGVAGLVASMRDPAVVPLGSAQVSPELLPIRALNRTLASIAREASTAGAAYDAPQGLHTLRRQLARRSLTWGTSIDESEFVTTVGAMEALHVALRATTRPGDAVAVESPAYFGVLQLLEEMGRRVVEIPTRSDVGMDLIALEEALKKAPIKACIAIPNFDNPMGSLMPDDAKEKLVRLLARHDAPLIEDDIYGDLAFDGSRPRPAKAFDRDGRVLLVGSVSKTLAAGYRVGWIAAGRYQQQVERLKFSQSVSTPTLLQMAVAEYLDSGGYDRHLRQLRAHAASQVQRFREGVLACFPEGTRVSEPKGGFFLWVELPHAVDALQLQAQAYERGIAIAPGPIFSARARYGSCIRLSCGFPWSDRFDAAVRTLGELADTAVRKSRTA
jgi:DNA-binding transcriptional MocR family regulator